MSELTGRIHTREGKEVYWVIAAVAFLLAVAFFWLAWFDAENLRLNIVWLLPASRFFLIVSGLAISYIAIARGLLRKEPFFIVVGMAFWLPSIVAFLTVLVWPGLVSDSAVLTVDPSAPNGLLLLTNLLLSVCILGAAFHNSLSWDNLSRISIFKRAFAWLFAATVSAVSLSMVVLIRPEWIILPDSLHPIRNGSAVILILILFAFGANLYSFKRSRNNTNAFLALTSIVVAFVSATGVMQHAVYDGWWAAGVSAEMIGWAILLLAMLQQYVDIQRQQDQLGAEVKTLYDSSAEISNMLDLRSTADHVIERLMQVTGASASFFNLLNESAGLEMVAVRGMDMDECRVNEPASTPFQAQRGFSGWIVEHGESIIANDPWNDPRCVGLPPNHMPIDSFLGVPIKIRGNSIGIVALANKPGGFTAEDERAVMTLSAQMAVAVENARLYETIDKELKRKIAELEGMVEAATRLAASADRFDTLETALSVVERLFGAAAVWVSAYNEDTGLLELEAWRGGKWPADTKLALRPGQGVAGMVFLTGEPLFVADIAADPRFVYKREMLDNRLNSMICVPLKGKKGPLGTLSLHIPSFSADRQPTTAEIELIQAFASQLAMAIERADLDHAQRQEILDLEALQALSDDAMGAADMASLLEKVLRVAARLLHANTGVVYFLDESDSFLISRRTFNLGDESNSGKPIVGVGEGVAGRAVSDRRPVRVLDAAKHELGGPKYIEERHIRSMVAVPLSYGDKVIGAIELGRLALWHFTDHDVRMLQMMAEKVAIAAERANLYEQLKGVNSQLTFANVWLQGVIDNLPEGVVINDSLGIVSMINKAARNLLGHSATIGLPVEDLVEAAGIETTSGDIFPVSQFPLIRAMTGDAVIGTEAVISREDGNPLYLVVNAAPLSDGDGQVAGAVAVMQDVSNLKELDQLKDNFISIASHELKNPLTAIIGHIQMMERRFRSQEGVIERRSDARNIQIIAERADRMARLIDDLLDVSRIQAGRLELEMQLVNITELVGDVVEQTQSVSTKHKLVLRNGAPIHGHCDGGRIEQVVHNLLNNAIKYSPNGGSVEISVSQSGNEAIIEVKDQGIGIPSDQIGRLFDRFYRIRDKRAGAVSGLGLGLYICKEIVTGHGGRIWVESRQGQGSTFCFTLPGIQPSRNAGGSS